MIIILVVIVVIVVVLEMKSNVRIERSDRMNREMIRCYIVN